MSLRVSRLCLPQCHLCASHVVMSTATPCSPPTHPSHPPITPLPLAPAFSGLQVDIDRVRADNEAKVDEQRKAGLIIWSGRELGKEGAP